MQKIIVYFAFKIKDGLYIGNQRSPGERDFIMQNKITHVVNCASSQIKINTQQFGLKVLAFDWLDNDQQVILDDGGKNIDAIYEFMEEAAHEHEGILVCSQRGQSRALTIITAYLMRKFSWSLYKTLQYMNSKRVDFEIRAVFLKQLLNHENKLFEKTPCSKDWEDRNESGEALVVRNTFMNTHVRLDAKSPTPIPTPTTTATGSRSQTKSRLRWKEQLVEVITDGEVPPIQKTTKEPLKSLLKVVDTQQTSQIKPKMEQLKQQQQDFQYKSQEPQVQLNINLNVNQVNIINRPKNNNFIDSTPKYSDKNLSQYTSNQKDLRSRSHSQGFKNQPKSINIQKQPQQNLQQNNRSITPDPTQKQNKQTPKQLFEIYLDTGPINMNRNQFFEKSTKGKPRQLTPIQMKPSNINMGPLRSVSQNQKVPDFDLEEYLSVKTNMMPKMRARDKRFQIRK